MSVHYRVDMLPLEPYTFGTEQGSKFAGGVETGKESYIIASGKAPEQTTILGTLRYIVLRQKGLLNSDFAYSEEEQKLINTAIGAESFSFTAKREQDFGQIRKVSPLFLIERTDPDVEPEIYIKMPFHYLRAKDAKAGFADGSGTESGGKYYPLKPDDKKFETSFGEIRLPRTAGDGSEKDVVYDAKAGHGSGYIRLRDKAAAPGNLFTICMQTGNRTGDENPDRNESFFKRETVMLKENFEFSVYVEAEEGSFPGETVAFMGRKRTAFRFRFTQVTGQEAAIVSKVEDAFADEPECWYYALSDLYLEEAPEYGNFAIVESKGLRNIETRAAEKEYVKKRGKKKFQFHLIESGSVFLGMMDFLRPMVQETYTDNRKNIGYNTVVCLGGKQHGSE